MPPKAGHRATGPTASEFQAAVAEKAGLTKAQVKLVLETCQDEVSKVLRSGGQVRLLGVKIAVKHKKATPAREGRNPATGAAMTIAAKPARRVVKATPLKVLKELV